MKSGNSDGSVIYPSLHSRYIAYVYPKYCEYNGWNFPQRTFGFNTGKLFCLLLMVCYFMLSIQLNFLVQSVLYSCAYLSDSHQI